MLLLMERVGPLISGIAVAAIYLFVDKFRSYVLPETIPALLSAVVTVAAIAVGFLATAKSILIAADDRPIIQRIKQAGFYNRIIGYFRSAIAWSFALSVVSAIPLIFDYRGLTTWDWCHAIGTSIWLFVAAGSLVAYWRLSGIWYKTLSHLDAPSP